MAEVIIEVVVPAGLITTQPLHVITDMAMKDIEVVTADTEVVDIEAIAGNHKQMI